MSVNKIHTESANVDIEFEADTCLARAALASRMSEQETMAFHAHAVARSVAAIPFIANCPDPHRTSLALLATYVTGNRSGGREVFDHVPLDNEGSRRFDIAARLLTGGSKEIVEAMIARWELVTLYGHLSDIEDDLAAGLYNPLVNAGWDYSRKEQELWELARFGEFAQLDWILGASIIRFSSW